MATGEQLKALLRSYRDHDQDRFLAVAMQVAAHAARRGHGNLAKELRELVDALKAGTDQRSDSLPTPIPVVRPTGELAGLLDVQYPKTRPAEMVLSEAVRGRLSRVMNEQRQRYKLVDYGLLPRRKLLLVGPPGTGKTMSAAALAGELGLPLFTILLHGLITKFLGETAAKLHLVFNAMKNARGVYFFDEFDAIGGHRETHNDIAEIRRTLNSFLQFIEQDQSESLIVAATNNKGLLDRALFRRFDDVIEYELPTPELASELIRSRLAIFRLAGISWDKVKQASQGLSQADVVAACDDVAKALVMSGTSLVKTKQLVTAMGERANM